VIRQAVPKIGFDRGPDKVEGRIVEIALSVEGVDMDAQRNLILINGEVQIVVLRKTAVPQRRGPPHRDESTALTDPGRSEAESLEAPACLIGHLAEVVQPTLSV
jgi:hypothetical protein